MQFEDDVALMIPLTWIVMLAVEALATGRRWPPIRLWRFRGAGFFVLMMTLNAVLPALWPASISGHHLFDAHEIGIAGSVALGFLVLSLANAATHRAYHRFDFLWRWVHQFHHSPQRLDVSSAVMTSPLELIIGIGLFQVVVVFLLGLDPKEASLVGYVAAFYGMFQHFNVRTPQWIGYLIQRPESHCVHHRRGVHAYNYSDLPLWDIYWDTFRNPQQFCGEVGFASETEGRMLAMLAGCDANANLYGVANRGREDAEGNPA